MIILLTILHIVICVFLVIVVLLQSGKAADLAGAFGGMGSQTAFGPRGSATVLSKATTIAAGLFMVTSLTLAILSSRSSGPSSVTEKSTGASQSAPANKGATPAAPPAGQPGQPAPITVTPQGGAPVQVTPVTPPPAQKAPAEAPAKK
jgi:preprotein translocase subunit SecG